VYFGRASVYFGRELGISAVIFCKPAALSLQVDGRVVHLGLGDGWSLVQHGLVAPRFSRRDFRPGLLDPAARQVLQD